MLPRPAPVQNGPGPTQSLPGRPQPTTAHSENWTASSQQAHHTEESPHHQGRPGGPGFRASGDVLMTRPPCISQPSDAGCTLNANAAQQVRTCQRLHSAAANWQQPLQPALSSAPQLLLPTAWPSAGVGQSPAEPRGWILFSGLEIPRPRSPGQWEHTEWGQEA